MGTTSFMVVMHVLATVALLPRFWSWQGVVAFGILYWMTVLGVTLVILGLGLWGTILLQMELRLFMAIVLGIFLRRGHCS